MVCLQRCFRRNLTCIVIWIVGLSSTSVLVHFWALNGNFADVRVLYSGPKTAENSSEEKSPKNTSTQADQPAPLQKTARSPTKILIQAYMRGGSTFLSEVFNQNPEAILWYEPLAPVYGSLFGLPLFRVYTLIVQITNHSPKNRILSPWEEEQIVEYFENLFNCRLLSLPRESLTDKFMLKTSKLQSYISCYQRTAKGGWDTNCFENSGVGEFCTGKTFSEGVTYAERQGCHVYLQKVAQLAEDTPNITLDELAESVGTEESNETLKYFFDHEMCMQNLYNVVKECLYTTHAVDSCTESRIRAAKVLRLKMPYVAPIMKAIPDLFILHYFRDPRGIAKSRTAITRPDFPDSDWIRNTKNVCIEMEQDILAAVSLDIRFPGRLLSLKYEDVIHDAKEALGKMHQQVGRELPNEVLHYIEGIMHAKMEDGPFQVRRKNASSLVDSWRHTFSKEAIDKVNALSPCKFVFQQLGYSAE